MPNLKIDEIKIVVVDLQMALDVRKQLKANGDNVGVMSFADGERISIKLSVEKLDQIDDKIISLGEQLKQKVTDLSEEDLK